MKINRNNDKTITYYSSVILGSILMLDDDEIDLLIKTFQHNAIHSSDEFDRKESKIHNRIMYNIVNIKNDIKKLKIINHEKRERYINEQILEHFKNKKGNKNER